MIGLLQRVTSAEVRVGAETVGEIGRGLMVLVAVHRDDTPKDITRLAERLLGYRVFPDDEGRMNLSVRDIGGGLLLVPQFTLTADTRKGTRASFTKGAAPRRKPRITSPSLLLHVLRNWMMLRQDGSGPTCRSA
jgi:D-tyrosyl-tRNA(Tyr) deacylase